MCECDEFGLLGERVHRSEGEMFWCDGHVPHSFGGLVTSSGKDNVAFVGDDSFFFVEMSGAAMVDEDSEG